jgi:ribose transport system substrate-binding protein
MWIRNGGGVRVSSDRRSRSLDLRKEGPVSRKVLVLVAAVTAALVAALAAALHVSRATSAATKTLHFALVTGDNHDPFYVTMNEGAQAEAKKLHVKVSWQGPATFEAAPQITILDTLLASKPDFLIVAPTDVNALVAPIQQFNKAKVPVLTVDTDVNKHSVRLGNITSNNTLGGQIAAKYLISHGAKTLAYIGEQRGVFTTDQRWKGFESAVKKSKTVKYVGPQFGADDPNTATSIVDALLTRYPTLDGIFASDTAYGQGAATAIQNAGKAGKVKVVAFDAEPDEVTALNRGLIQALIVQKAYDMGVDAVKYAYSYLTKGTRPPAETHPTYVIATKANIRQPGVAKYIYHQK